MRTTFLIQILMGCVSCGLVFGPTAAWAKKIQVEGTSNQKDLAAASDASDESNSNAESAPQLEYGEKAARKHFVKRSERREASSDRVNEHVSEHPEVGEDTHYLALTFGTYISSSSWYWDGDHNDNPGRLTFGVTYRVGEWAKSMDLNFRGDFSTYQQRDGSALKLSLLPLITFPDASSKFPLFFGVGAGLGIYFQQIQGQQGSSPLSFDYQLIAGARFFNISGSTGFLVEGGLKNSLHLTNSGQFNGAFASVGAVFTF